MRLVTVIALTATFSSALRRGIQKTSVELKGAGCMYWIPRRSAELKVAVKAMTVTDHLD